MAMNPAFLFNRKTRKKAFIVLTFVFNLTFEFIELKKKKSIFIEPN